MRGGETVTRNSTLLRLQILNICKMFISLHRKGRECMSPPHSLSSNLPKMTTPRGGFFIVDTLEPEILRKVNRSL